MNRWASSPDSSNETASKHGFSVLERTIQLRLRDIEDHIRSELWNDAVRLSEDDHPVQEAMEDLGSIREDEQILESLDEEDRDAHREREFSAAVELTVCTGLHPENHDKFARLFALRRQMQRTLKQLSRQRPHFRNN